MVCVEWQAQPSGDRGGKDFQHGRHSRNLQQPWRAKKHELGAYSMVLQMLAAWNLLCAWLSPLASVFPAPPNPPHSTSYSPGPSVAENVAAWTERSLIGKQQYSAVRTSFLPCSAGPVGGAEPSLAKGCPGTHASHWSVEPSTALETLIQASGSEL